MQRPDGLGPREKGGPLTAGLGDAPFGFDETRPLPDAAFCVIGGLDFFLWALGWIHTHTSITDNGQAKRANKTLGTGCYCAVTLTLGSKSLE